LAVVGYGFPTEEGGKHQEGEDWSKSVLKKNQKVGTSSKIRWNMILAGEGGEEGGAGAVVLDTGGPRRRDMVRR